MQHTFNVELAEKYGVNEAIVLNNFGVLDSQESSK